MSGYWIEVGICTLQMLGTAPQSCCLWFLYRSGSFGWKRWSHWSLSWSDSALDRLGQMSPSWTGQNKKVDFIDLCHLKWAVLLFQIYLATNKRYFNLQHQEHKYNYVLYKWRIIIIDDNINNKLLLKTTIKMYLL